MQSSSFSKEKMTTGAVRDSVPGACARCSTAKSWVALHPAQCQGSKRKYGCLAAHRRDPSGGGYKQHCEEISGTSKKSKRRRKIDLIHI